MDRVEAVIRGGGAVGYYRMMPTDEGDVHLMWKWTRGEWKDHYVYVFCAVDHNWKMCIALLRQKRDEVEAGTRKPTKDKWTGRH